MRFPRIIIGRYMGMNNIEITYTVSWKRHCNKTINIAPLNWVIRQNISWIKDVQALVTCFRIPGQSYDFRYCYLLLDEASFALRDDTWCRWLSGWNCGNLSCLLFIVSSITGFFGLSQPKFISRRSHLIGDICAALTDRGSNRHLLMNQYKQYVSYMKCDKF